MRYERQDTRGKIWATGYEQQEIKTPAKVSVLSFIYLFDLYTDLYQIDKQAG